MSAKQSAPGEGSVTGLEELAEDLGVESPQHGSAITRLQKLADELSRVYPIAAERIAKALAPVDAALEKIGVPWKDIEGTTPALESDDAGDTVTDYRLCVLRGTDRRCRVHVHAQTFRRDENDPDEWQTVQESLMMPSELPLPLRVKIVDVLDDFVGSYVAYVRQERKNLLNGSVVPRSSAD